MDTRRRSLIRAGLAGATLALLPARAASTTPSAMEGPFYPQTLPRDRDNDLVQYGESGEMAEGEITELHGRILDIEGRPLAGAKVEIWQCDARGRYHHVDDYGRGRRDDGFQGYGRTQTSADGSYRFRTIKPAPYPGRTPHIHCKVRARGYRGLTTQLYVAGDPRNERDGLFRSLAPEEQALVQAEWIRGGDASAPYRARFDLVLA